MSGLLERIVRRRRASARRRLGTPSRNGMSIAQSGAYADRVPPSETPPRAETIVWLRPTQPKPAPDRPSPDTPSASAFEPSQNPPAPTEAQPLPNPEPTDSEPHPGFRERGRMRRRARYLARLREVQLRDIGGFVLELHRFGRERPGLVQEKVASAARTDSELRALERALGAQQSFRELRRAGIGGTCRGCGAVHGSEDRFCASCGQPLQRAARPPDEQTELN